MGIILLGCYLFVFDSQAEDAIVQSKESDDGNQSERSDDQLTDQETSGAPSSRPEDSAMLRRHREKNPRVNGKLNRIGNGEEKP